MGTPPIKEKLEFLPFSCCQSDYQGRCDRHSSWRTFFRNVTSTPAQFHSKGCLNVLTNLENPVILVAIASRLISCVCTFVLMIIVRYLSSAFKSRFIDLNPAELGYLC